MLSATKSSPLRLTKRKTSCEGPDTPSNDEGVHQFLDVSVLNFWHAFWKILAYIKRQLSW